MPKAGLALCTLEAEAGLGALYTAAPLAASIQQANGAKNLAVGTAGSSESKNPSYAPSVGHAAKHPAVTCCHMLEKCA